MDDWYFYDDNPRYESFKHLVKKSFKNLPTDVSGIIAEMAYEPPPFCGDEDGEDISHCTPDPVVSVILQVSSDWVYILEWRPDEDDEPRVYRQQIGQPIIELNGIPHGHFEFQITENDGPVNTQHLDIKDLTLVFSVYYCKR